MSRVFIALFIILLTPSLAAASSVVRVGDKSNFAVDQLVEGDFYWIAESVALSGEVTEDLLIASPQVAINGAVGGDVFVVGGIVVIDGTISDDVRVLAGEVQISGEIKGDLVVVAGSLKVLSTANISGDLLFFGEEADISGQVVKSILGTSGSIRIDGVVGGDVEIKTDSLSLGDRAEVTGIVKYISNNELLRSQEATVTGKIVREEPAMSGSGTLFRDLIIPFLVILFASLVWFLLFPNVLRKVSNQAHQHLIRSTLIGFGILILVPIAAIILILSSLGSLVGLTMLFIYFTLFVISFTIMGVVAGVIVLGLLKKSWPINISLVLLGTSLIYLILFLPIIGLPLVVLTLLATLGALTTVLYRLART